MIAFAPAKINLGLRIVGKRSDGYHNLSSIFYPIPLCDALEIERTLHEKSGGLRLYHYGLKAPCADADNLLTRTWEAMASMFQLPAISLHVFKTIPWGAGLGGGSSNASTFLLMLNELLNFPLNPPELHEIALKLGSDCPFFLEPKPSLASARGEVLEPIDPFLKGKYLVVLFPRLEISTSWAFKQLDHEGKWEGSQEPILPPQGDSFTSIDIHNDFEPIVLSAYPQIRELKVDLLKAGFEMVGMSGSGSSFYALSEIQRRVPSRWESSLIWSGWIT